MKSIVFTLIILISSHFNPEANDLQTKCTSSNILSFEQDTLKDLQNLYTGKIWTNRYRNILENQFLFATFFLPGTVSSKGKMYKNLLLKYDIYSDEILIPVNDDEIIQLNKELIDSFSINFENKLYKFINISSDTVFDLKDFKGYINVALKGESTLYIKYKKEILSSMKNIVDFEFIQSQKIYLANRNKIFSITSKADLYRVLDADINQINNYVESNRLNVSIKEPESFIQIIRFCNNINR
jgi:hypothetical protein